MGSRQKSKPSFKDAIWDLLRSALDSPHIPEKSLLVYARILCTGVYAGSGICYDKIDWCRMLRINRRDLQVFLSDMEARGYLYADMDEDDVVTIFPGMRKNREILE